MQPFVEVPGEVLATLTQKDIQPSYQKSDQAEAQNILGCRHYQRNCKLFAECCQDWILCRYCHDEGTENEISEEAKITGESTELKMTNMDRNNDGADSEMVLLYRVTASTAAASTVDIMPVKIELPKSQEFLPSHTLEYSSVNYVLCMLCQQPQPLATSCRHCLTPFATYSCLSCRIFENDPKKIANLYHCTPCGLCRVGPASDYQHCATCDCCILTSVPHKCIEKNCLQIVLFVESSCILHRVPSYSCLAAMRFTGIVMLRI